MRNRKLAGNSICSIVLLLCFGYIIIAFNNRYQFDDLGFFSTIRDHGIWKSFLIMYYSWETTYNTLLLFGLLKWVNKVPPYVFNIPILLINIYSFFLLLRTLFKSFRLNINFRDTLLLSALIIALTYFSCRAMGNVVYWVTGQIVYCLFLCFLFFGLHFWVKKKFLLASIFMFLFGHTRINYDAIFLGLYASYFLYTYYANKKIVIKWKDQIPFLFFLLGLISYVIIPGNYKRVDSFHLAGSPQNLSVFIVIEGLLSAFKHLIGTIFLSWKQLIILPIGVLLGFYLSNNDYLKKVLNGKFLIFCTLAFIIAYIGQSSVLLISIGSPVGYGRIFFFLELLLFLLFLLYGVYFGILLQSKFNPTTISFLIYGLSFPILLVIGNFFYRNLEVTNIFAKAYDKRISYLEELKYINNADTIYLPPLPDSGVLKFMEILPEVQGQPLYPDDNAVYVRYYGLPFKLYLAK